MESIIDERGLELERESTVEEIISKLDDTDKVACVRYTGFAKSYYIVPELIKRLNKAVLILVPNIALKSQYKDKFKYDSRVSVITYQALTYISDEDIINIYGDVEYIICDECHRIGKNKWKQQVERIINVLVGVKVIGLTATPTRGDKIDIVESFFEGEQVKSINLLDGISNKYLPKIKYVVAFAKIDKVVDKKLTEIDRYRIHNLINIPNTLKKYIDEDKLKTNLKVLVFVPYVSNIKEAEEESRRWFEEAYPDKEVNIYSVSYTKTAIENKDELNQYKETHSNKEIDIMVSVNKLVEGLHLPLVSVEIMLRKTASPVVYFQQMGRVINAGEPLIFDLINNSNQLYAIKREFKTNMGYQYKDDISKMNKYADKEMIEDCIELYTDTLEIEKILDSYSPDKNTSTQIDSIVLENIDYIQKNPDSLSLSKLAHKLGISISALYNSFVRLNIHFDNGKWRVESDELDKRLLADKEYIENMSGKTHYVELAKKYNITKHTLKYRLMKLGINFVSMENNTFKQDKIDNIVLDNIEYIKEAMGKITITDQATKLGLRLKPYIHALERNNIEIVRLTNEVIDVDENILNKVIELRKTNTDIDVIKKELNLTDYEYTKYRTEAVNRGYIPKRQVGKVLMTEEIREFIKANSTKMTSQEIADVFNVPRKCIQSYINKNHIEYKRAGVKPKKITPEITDRIIKLYNEGNNYADISRKIADEISLDKSTIKRVLINNDITLNKPIVIKARRKVTDEEKANILNDYNNGMSKKDIGIKYNRDSHVLDRIFGIEPKKLTDQERALIIQLHLAGSSIKEISQKLNMTVYSVRNVVAKYNREHTNN